MRNCFQTAADFAKEFDKEPGLLRTRWPDLSKKLLKVAERKKRNDDDLKKILQDNKLIVNDGKA